MLQAIIAAILSAFSDFFLKRREADRAVATTKELERLKITTKIIIEQKEQETQREATKAAVANLSTADLFGKLRNRP